MRQRLFTSHEPLYKASGRVKNQIWLSCSDGAFFFQADFDFMDLVVLVVYHGFFIAVVGIVRDFGLADFLVVDGDVHTEVVIVDDGEGPAVRQEGQAFGLFDVPALGAEVQDEFFLGRYDFPVQAAVFEVAVISDGRSTVQVGFVDEVLHGAVYVDKDNQGNGTLQRRKKDSFEYYKKVIASNGQDLELPAED